MFEKDDSFDEDEESNFLNKSHEGTKSKVQLSPSSEIRIFCRLLSHKAGFSINNLKEALQYIEDYIPNEKQNETFPSFDSSKTLNLEKRTETLESENNSLRDAFSAIKSEKEELETQISSFKNQIFDLQKQVSSTKTSNRKTEIIQEYTKQLLDQINSQISEISQITEQRNSLLRVIEKQNKLLNTEFMVNTQIQEQKTVESDKEDKEIEVENSFSSQDFHFLLVKLSSIASQIVPKLSMQIREIEDQYETTTIERMESIVTLLATEIQRMEKSQKVVEKVKQEMKMQKERSQRCLSMLEEELRFLAATSGSEQLQKALFFDRPDKMQICADNECKKELLRRSTKIARFIEEQNLKFEEFELPAEVQPTEVFKLFTAVNFREKLQNFMERVSEEDKENDDIRELFCLFTAQVIANSVLQSYSMEANQKAIAGNATIKAMSETLAKVDERRKELRQKYNSLKETIKLSPSFNKEKTLENNLIDAFGVFKANQDLIKTNNNLQENISNLNISIQTLEHENESKSQEITEKECMIKEFEQKIEALTEEINNNEVALAAAEKEKSNLQSIIAEKREKLSTLEVNFEQIKADHEELTNNYNSCKEKLDSSKMFVDKLQAELQKTVAELNNVSYELKQVSDKKEELEAQISSQCIKNKMQETSINDLFQRMDSQKERLEELEKERVVLLEDSNELKKMKEEIKKCKKTINLLNEEAAKGVQWMIWARRVLSTFDEEYPNESETRLALESHVLEPNGAVLMKQKLECLRCQKKFLNMFVNKKAFSSKGKDVSIKSLMIVSLFYSKFAKIL